MLDFVNLVERASEKEINVFSMFEGGVQALKNFQHELREYAKQLPL